MGKAAEKKVETFVLLPVACDEMQALYAQSSQVFDRHSHDDYVFGVLDQGAQKWHAGRHPVEAEAGDLMMSNPGEVHDGTPIGDGGRTWRMLHVNPAKIWRVAEELDYAQPVDFEFARPAVRDARLATLVAELIDSVTSTEGSTLRQDELMLVAMRRLGQSKQRRNESLGRIAQAKTRIDDSPAATVSLAELAKASGLSQWQLLRSFARLTGYTPHAYQIQRRIEMARALIARGLSLVEAASASGFSDQSHMTRTFRRKYGLSPLAWAKSHRRRD